MLEKASPKSTPQRPNVQSHYDHSLRVILLAGQRMEAQPSTYGGKGDTLDAWFAHVAELVARFDEAVAASGRGPLDRYLSLDSSPQFSLASASVYAEMAGRAADLGFTDVVSHWPRPDTPYAGDPAVLEEVAGSLRR